MNSWSAGNDETLGRRTLSASIRSGPTRTDGAITLRPGCTQSRARATDRATRERLATRLDFEGFGTLGPNLWISADRRAQAGAESVLAVSPNPLDESGVPPLEPPKVD